MVPSNIIGHFVDAWLLRSMVLTYCMGITLKPVYAMKIHEDVFFLCVCGGGVCTERLSCDYILLYLLV